jgi:hypothetical protein
MQQMVAATYDIRTANTAQLCTPQVYHVVTEAYYVVSWSAVAWQDQCDVYACICRLHVLRCGMVKVEGWVVAAVLGKGRGGMC